MNACADEKSKRGGERLQASIWKHTSKCVPCTFVPTWAPAPMLASLLVLTHPHADTHRQTDNAAAGLLARECAAVATAAAAASPRFCCSFLSRPLVSWQWLCQHRKRG